MHDRFKLAAIAARVQTLLIAVLLAVCGTFVVLGLPHIHFAESATD